MIQNFLKIIIVDTIMSSFGGKKKRVSIISCLIMEKIFISVC